MSAYLCGVLALGRSKQIFPRMGKDRSPANKPAGSLDTPDRLILEIYPSPACAGLLLLT